MTNPITLPILFKKSRTGAILQWKCTIKDNELHIVYGQEDGKQITTLKVSVGKNIGKKNETTNEEQALLDAQSLWTKKKEREQYRESIEELEEIQVAPMLAHDINKHWKCIEEEFKNSLSVAVSKKLDGNRLLCSIQKEDNYSIQFYSRKLTTITSLEHLIEDVIKFIEWNNIECPVYLDGEAYIHGESLQVINSRLKKKQEGTELIKYNVYDCYFPNNSNLGFKERFMDLFNKETKNVTLVKSVLCTNKDDLDYYLSEYEADGYEGAMVRFLNQPYQVGSRSKYLLKYKRFEDAEYKIVDFNFGKDKYDGCVIWKLITPEGEIFEALAEGTLEQKKVVNPQDFINKYATVKFKGKTDKKIPKFGIVKGIREDI